MFTLEKIAVGDIVPRARTDTTLVTVVETDEVVCLGVVAALAESTDFTPVAVHGDVQEVETTVGLVLLGVPASGAHDSVPAVRHLVESGATVVIHSADEHPVPLRMAIAGGAAGIALHRDGIDGLTSVMHASLAGRLGFSSPYAEQLCCERELAARLSAREADVLECLSDGLTHRQAARRLGIDEETVKTHLKSVRAKYMTLGRAVTNVGTLMREARNDGWLN
jgi:DNA-binding NarL/FixJ family response regulator